MGQKIANRCARSGRSARCTTSIRWTSRARRGRLALAPCARFAFALPFIPALLLLGAGIALTTGGILALTLSPKRGVVGSWRDREEEREASPAVELQSISPTFDPDRKSAGMMASIRFR